MVQRTYYDILNVSVEANAKEIKKSYRRLVLRYHPDVTRDSDSEIFQEIIRAYEVLGDEMKRLEYNHKYGLAKHFWIKVLIKKKAKLFQKVKHCIFLVNPFKKRFFFTNFSDFTKDYFQVSNDIIHLGMFELRRRFESSSNKLDRLEFLKGIIKLEGRNGYKMIQRALEDDSQEVRKLGILAIGKLRIRQGIFPLYRIYLNSETDLKRQIIQVIASLKIPKAEEYLIQFCYDKNEELRIEALKCVKEYHLLRCISKLKDLLYDKSPQVQELIRSML